MSSGGQIVGGIVGAIVGYVATGFNPYGAFQGAAIGAGIGGYLDPPKGPTVSGPRLADLSVQTSTYGAFIPRVYGTVGITGNMLWLENNQLRERTEKEESGGKGGGSSQTIKTYNYSATFAVGLCEGPIVGVKRIWCADKLIYNASSDNVETIIASNTNAAGWTLYLGTDDQEPDPRYEADVGVGNAPSFRGMAYIVFEDFELGDYGNTLQVAQFKFEVVTEQSIAQITEIGRYQIPSSVDSYPGNGTLISDSGFGYVSTGLGDLTIYRVNSSGYFIESELDGSTWKIVDGFSRISLTSQEPAWAAWGGSVTKINGDDYQISASNAACIGIAPNGDIYSCTANTNPLNVYKVNTPVPFVVYNSNIEPSFQRQTRSILVDNNNVFIFSTQPASGSGVLTKLEILNNQLSFVSEVSGLDIGNFASAQDAGSLIYINNGDSISAGQRIVAIDKSTLQIVSNISYPTAPVVSSSTGLTKYNRNRSGIIATITDENTITELVIYKLNQQTVLTVPLRTVFEEESIRSSLVELGDLDATLLTDEVTGYRISGGTIRASIEPLQGAFPFDVRQHGYLIQAVPRGQLPVATVEWEELGASASDVTDALRQSREMDSQLPYRVNIKYLDAAREYAISEQYAERLNTEAVNRVDREYPLVMTANKAASVSEVLLFLPWLERIDFSFNLPQTYQNLEPADVITLNDRYATYELRLTDVKYTADGLLECRAKSNRASLYDPNAEGSESPGPGGNIPLTGPTVLAIFDIPVVDETVQNQLGYLVGATGYTDGWPGALVVISSDNGQTWTNLQALQSKATFGFSLSTLPSSSATLIDQRTLSVALISGSLSSLTRDQMLAGANYAAYGVNGRWEIVRFQNAALQADGSYLVSGFVRGERGTEWATGLHQVGDYFVLLDDPDLAFVRASIEQIGIARTYRGVTAGSALDSAVNQSFTYNGVNLECLSPVYASGSRDGSSNFTGTFTRRSRLSTSWWTTGVETAVGEESLAFEVDVMSGSTVVRTITTSTTSFSYSAANQTTDFGSPQASITFRIYQMSATVGRGYPLEVTL